MRVIVLLSADGVKACHETRTARRADRALAVGVSERDSLAYETIDGGSLDMRIAEGADGIKSLQIGAVPEDVGARHNFLGTGFCRQGRLMICCHEGSVAISLYYSSISSSDWFHVNL